MEVEEPEVDLSDLILDLDQDLDFAGADFTDLNSSQGGAGASQKEARDRSESADPTVKPTGAKRRRMGKVA